MPQITDQVRLLKDFDMESVSKGPLDGTLRCHYFTCPKCDYFVLKGAGYGECRCGNISIDSYMLRVTVSVTPESEVETYNDVKKLK
jgi:hypothetical protein